VKQVILLFLFVLEGPAKTFFPGFFALKKGCLGRGRFELPSEARPNGFSQGFSWKRLSRSSDPTKLD